MIIDLYNNILSRKYYKVVFYIVDMYNIIQIKKKTINKTRHEQRN